MSDFSGFCQTVFQSDCVETLPLQFILVSLWDYSLNSSFEGTLHVPSITLKVNVLLETSSGRTEAHEPEAGLKPQPPSFECVTARTLGACVCRALCWGDGGDKEQKIAFWPEKKEGDLEGTAVLPQLLAVAGGGSKNNGKTDTQAQASQ